MFLYAIHFLYGTVSENSLSSAANSVSSAINSASSLWHTENRLRRTHWVLSPEPCESQQTHWARCLNPYSPKPCSAPFRCFQESSWVCELFPLTEAGKPPGGKCPKKWGEVTRFSSKGKVLRGCNSCDFFAFFPSFGGLTREGNFVVFPNFWRISAPRLPVPFKVLRQNDVHGGSGKLGRRICRVWKLSGRLSGKEHTRALFCVHRGALYSAYQGHIDGPGETPTWLVVSLRVLQFSDQPRVFHKS